MLGSPNEAAIIRNNLGRQMESRLGRAVFWAPSVRHTRSSPTAPALTHDVLSRSSVVSPFSHGWEWDRCLKASQRLLRMTTVSLGRALGVAVVERELAHHLTEVCDGGSLASYRYRTAYESLEQASAEIILGLNWLHEHGIVHHWHDLKPHNTALVNGSSHCVVADYGGARFLNGERKLTGTCGNDTSRATTTAFVAPETRNLAPSMSCVAAAEPRNPHAPALSTS
ncbi:hypothetical protein LXA43DRAFT_1132725 [Ganoderma leucocontextum]|nr:hypothetical protein LXA43DRAFT_1132725 [Ganoderma leucocontextum]